MIRSLARILAVSALVAVTPVTAPADLLIEPNVSSFDGMVSDRFTSGVPVNAVESDSRAPTASCCSTAPPPRPLTA